MKDDYQGFSPLKFGESTGVGAGITGGWEDYISEEEWV